MGWGVNSPQVAFDKREQRPRAVVPADVAEQLSIIFTDVRMCCLLWPSTGVAAYDFVGIDGAKMAPLLFCNVGWMARYQGLRGQPDKIVGGGQYVNENGTGNEVCNFLAADDGWVYGHVETIKGDLDRDIRLDRLGSTDKQVDHVDVVWTATNPTKGGRRVVGWYRDATVYRSRQYFQKAPSRQHRADKLASYRIKTKADLAQWLPIEDRSLSLSRGPGWMGHTPWWVPPSSPDNTTAAFLDSVRLLVAGGYGRSVPSPTKISNSAGASSDGYTRYAQAYEAFVSPRHAHLQDRFEAFLASTNPTVHVTPNLQGVDLRFQDNVRGLVLVEIKPCTDQDARYAIRTAMGQLMDYRQRVGGTPSLLIVIEVAPTEEDLSLATYNGFGLSYPLDDGFAVAWP